MQHLKYEEKNSIATITFSRPDALNALNGELLTELNTLLHTIEKSDTLRVVVLTGEGKAFIAGADIADMKGKNSIEANAFAQLGQSTFAKLEKLPQVVMGAINGFALGGGLELALACDFLIASEKAKFSAPEVNLGLIPGFCGTQRLGRIIGLNNARYYLNTAAMFDAHEALRMGLVQKIVPAEELLNEVLRTAETIVSKGPRAIRALKRVVVEGMEKGFTSGSRKETEEFAQLFENEAQEGMQAFLEKRTPNWQAK
jgi:enoyl-CoA hydratase